MNATVIGRYSVYLKLVAVFLALSADLQAAEFNGTASITSDYYWRGYSKSDQNASLQINLDYSNIAQGSGYYLGTWLANIDHGDYLADNPADMEMVLYGGWSQSLTDDIRFDAQLSHYLFDEKLFGKHRDYSEIYALIHYGDLLTAEVSYAPDAYSTGESTLNSQLTLRYPMHTFIDFSAGAGYFAASEVFNFDYTYWNSGITLINNRFALDLRYFGASKSNGQSTYPIYSKYRRYELPFKRATAVVTLSVGL